MTYDIFISYRREGGAQYARILKAELEKRGYRGRVFLDYDELRDGKFDSRIMAAIDSARVFIFILSPGSLDRCCNADDWVRQEILYALEHEKHIIPVNFDGLFTGFPLAVPEEIRTALGQHQFSKIDSESLLDASMEKLIADRIAPLAAPQRSFAPQGVGAEIMVISDADCTVKAFGREIGTAKADTPSPIRLKKGNYLLEFISTENPQISEKQKYTVADNESVDFIEIKIKDSVVENRVLKLIKKDGKWGYIDEAGNTVIPFIYDSAASFTEGLACVDGENGKSGFINKAGKTVIPFRYAAAWPFIEGLACVRDENGKYGFINKTGATVIPFIYDCAESFSDGLAAVKNGAGKWGFINKEGLTEIPFLYNDAWSFHDGLAKVVNDSGKYGFINISGEVIIPFQYKAAMSFGEGLAAVKSEAGKWGYVDQKGLVVIPFIYKKASYFNKGFVKVMTEFDEWIYIDKKGNFVSKAE